MVEGQSVATQNSESGMCLLPRAEWQKRMLNLAIARPEDLPLGGNLNGLGAVKISRDRAKIASRLPSFLGQGGAALAAPQAAKLVPKSGLGVRFRRKKAVSHTGKVFSKRNSSTVTPEIR